MKYQSSSHIRPKKWSIGTLLQFKDKVNDMLPPLLVNERMPNNTVYKIGNFNLLRNGDGNSNDGQHKKAFPQRLSE